MMLTEELLRPIEKQPYFDEWCLSFLDNQIMFCHKSADSQAMYSCDRELGVLYCNIQHITHVL